MYVWNEWNRSAQNVHRPELQQGRIKKCRNWSPFADILMKENFCIPANAIDRGGE